MYEILQKEGKIVKRMLGSQLKEYLCNAKFTARTTWGWLMLSEHPTAVHCYLDV
jgi:hypothetical protein